MPPRRLTTLVLLTLLAAACQTQPSPPAPTISAVAPMPSKAPTMMNVPEIDHIQSFDGGELPFDAPYGVDVGPDGRLYVFDTKNRRVRVFDRSLKPLITWGQTGDGPGQSTRSDLEAGARPWGECLCNR